MIGEFKQLAGTGRSLGFMPLDYHDCREGICDMCSMINDVKVHEGFKNTTTCQVHMRMYKDGDTIVIEPFRAKAFPIIKDLAVDRSGIDKVMMAGCYVTTYTGNAQDGNAIAKPG